ncbi:MAG: TatD family hydrolase [Enterovibrio sp.]
MIDSHCHFDALPFDKKIELQKAQLAGVNKIIIPATHSAQWPALAALSAQFTPLYFALGVHPLFIENESVENAAQFLLTTEQQMLLNDRKCVAIGECGLDFSSSDNPSAQMQFLRMQCKLAYELDLPIILHCRKAHQPLLEILRQFPKLKGVLHSFSGSKELGLCYIKQGFLLGIGGTITYPRANKTRNAVKELPLQALVLETDAPYMPIFGHQGMANSPAFLPKIASALAELKNMPVSQVITATYENTQRLFTKLAT